MGVGPQILALYRQLKLLGALEGIERVMELGAQDAWSNRPSLVESLFEAFGRPAPDPELLKRLGAWKGSARELYQALGFSYECVDLMPDHGSLRLDLNFDEVPEGHRGRYDFVTNHGTSEHIFDQRNCFKAMHDFCRAGGLLL